MLQSSNCRIKTSVIYGSKITKFLENGAIMYMFNFTENMDKHKKYGLTKRIEFSIKPKFLWIEPHWNHWEYIKVTILVKYIFLNFWKALQIALKFLINCTRLLEWRSNLVLGTDFYKGSKAISFFYFIFTHYSLFRFLPIRHLVYSPIM